MDIYSENFTVTLSDIGENNKLTNKGILRLLQEIACIHSSLVGFGANDISNTGFFWILLNWKLKVFSRPSWNTKLKINTWSSNRTLVSFYRDFEVFDDTNNLIAIATSKWILFDFIKNSIVKITKEINAKYYNNIDKHVFDTSIIEKLQEPKKIELISEYSICKRDIDTNHHVNNLNYLDFAYEALPKFTNDFNNIEIMYKHEAKLGDILNLFYSKINNENFVIIKNKNTGKLHCIIKLY